MILLSVPVKQICRARRVRSLLLAGTLAAMNVCPALASDLRHVLVGLSRQYGFSVEGIEHVSLEEQVQEPHGSVQVQVGEVLRDYNYLLVAGPGRSIERVVIVGAKRYSPASVASAAVRMTRDGMHHRVEAVLVGPNGHLIPTSLIIDTGASNVVLPESMMEVLGYRPTEIRSTVSQTASGTVPVKLATLSSVSIGPNMERDVTVTFVQDKKLGDLRLLGMSFLSRFRVTIDDEKNELILLSR